MFLFSCIIEAWTWYDTLSSEAPCTQAIRWSTTLENTDMGYGAYNLEIRFKIILLIWVYHKISEFYSQISFLMALPKDIFKFTVFRGGYTNFIQFVICLYTCCTLSLTVNTIKLYSSTLTSIHDTMCSHGS